MKTNLNKSLVLLLIAAFFGCETDENLPVVTEQNLPSESVEPDPVLKDFLIKNGLPEKNLVFEDGRFIVDGCIVITKDKLADWTSNPKGSNLQTRTQAYVSVPAGQIKTITYRITSSIPSSTETLINEVISKYNSIRNFNITFQQTNSSNQDLLFRGVEDMPKNPVPSGRADWPTNGEIGYFIELDINDFNSSSITSGQKKFIIAHEIGHTIGFRHTDWIEQGEGNYGKDDGVTKFIGGTLIPGTYNTDPYSIYNSAPYYRDRNLPTPNFRSFYYTDLLAIRYLYSFDKTEQPFFAYKTNYGGQGGWTTDWSLNGFGNSNYPELQGINGYIYTTSKTGSIPLYMYKDLDTNLEYMTTDPNLSATYPNFTKIKTLGYVFNSSGTNRVPVYGYFNYTTGYYFTTLADDPRVTGSGWTGGGISFYAISLGS